MRIEIVFYSLAGLLVVMGLVWIGLGAFSALRLGQLSSLIVVAVAASQLIVAGALLAAVGMIIRLLSETVARLDRLNTNMRSYTTALIRHDERV